jgi:hypothetical protein
MAKIQRGETLRPALALTGAGKQPPHPNRHIAKQREERHRVMPLARQPATAGNAGATASHHAHLCRHDLILKGRHELLRLAQPKPKVSGTGLLIALDAGNLGLRHFTRPRLRHQFHPPHKLRHQSQPDATQVAEQLLQFRAVPGRQRRLPSPTPPGASR